MISKRLITELIEELNNQIRYHGKKINLLYKKLNELDVKNQELQSLLDKISEFNNDKVDLITLGTLIDLYQELKPINDIAAQKIVTEIRRYNPTLIGELNDLIQRTSDDKIMLNLVDKLNRE